MVFILTCAVGLIHLALTVNAAIAFFRKPPLATSKTTDKLSIVIAAHDEEQNLRKLLPLLLKQSYDDFEIIVALDRCQDASETYLNSLDSDKLSWITIKDVPENWNPKKYALNEAISHSSGDWLIFIDADCIPVSKNWLSLINGQIIASTDIIIGISPYQTGPSLLSRYIHFESFMTAYWYISKALKNDPYMAVGRNMAIRKSFFISEGGYNDFKSILGGDDDLFIQKNAITHNTSVLIGKETNTETYPKVSWKAYFNQKIRHVSVGNHYKPKNKSYLFMIHTTHMLFWILLLFNPLINLVGLLLFYLFIKLVSYRFAASKMGFNINYMLLPLVDILYAVLTPVIALWSKLEKDIKWKN
ncbi:glycosyltransferase [Ekhidna sp.]|uniref:glycosyltransferase n=1 Tax=Ekhidna sp. TaxID=2608089 RepID=UPI003B504848